MKALDQILSANKEWVKNVTDKDAEYFKRLSLGQSPQYLWIGCSDSRVPVAGKTHTEPGEFFIHRNIANQVITNDTNVMSVIKYAVDVLKVRHIVVCGHYGCGGIAAAIDNVNDEYLGDWLSGIKESYSKNKEYLDTLPTLKEKQDKLSEINVQRQVEKLASTSIIQHAWDRNQTLYLHGWIFDLDTGLLKPLVDINYPVR